MNSPVYENPSIDFKQRLQAAWRCFRNRCPHCGQAKILKNIFHIHEHCPKCHFLLDRGNGFMLGALPISYFMFVLVWLIPVLVSWAMGYLQYPIAMTLIIVGAIVMPLLLHGFSKLRWLGLYYFFMYHELNKPELNTLSSEQT